MFTYWSYLHFHFLEETQLCIWYCASVSLYLPWHDWISIMVIITITVNWMKLLKCQCITRTVIFLWLLVPLVLTLWSYIIKFVTSKNQYCYYHQLVNFINIFFLLSLSYLSHKSLWTVVLGAHSQTMDADAILQTRISGCHNPRVVLSHYKGECWWQTLCSPTPHQCLLQILQTLSVATSQAGGFKSDSITHRYD